MDKYSYNKNTRCLDCKKLISNKSIRCRKCFGESEKGQNNSTFIDGRTDKKYYCKDCGTSIGRTSGFYGNGRCLSCANRIKNLGKVFSKEHKENLRISHLGIFKGKKSPRFGKVSHSKYIKYKDIWMHSTWEVIYAKYLDKNNIKWQYESKAFDLGDTTYTPDFYLPEKDLYIEVKGYWRVDAKNKFKLFQKLYSNITILIIDQNIIEKIKQDKAFKNGEL